MELNFKINLPKINNNANTNPIKLNFVLDFNDNNNKITNNLTQNNNDSNLNINKIINLNLINKEDKIGLDNNKDNNNSINISDINFENDNQKLKKDLTKEDDKIILNNNTNIINKNEKYNNSSKNNDINNNFEQGEINECEKIRKNLDDSIHSKRSYDSKFNKSGKYERRPYRGTYRNRERDNYSFNNAMNYDFEMTDNASNELFIKGISDEMTEYDLKKTFSKYGKVGFLKIIKDKKTQKNKGIGIIRFKYVSSAIRAMEEKDNINCLNKKLEIKFNRINDNTNNEDINNQKEIIYLKNKSIYNENINSNDEDSWDSKNSKNNKTDFGINSNNIRLMKKTENDNISRRSPSWGRKSKSGSRYKRRSRSGSRSRSRNRSENKKNNKNNKSDDEW